MEKVSLTLTIFFQDGFYHGLFESVESGELSVCRVTFGAEPKLTEVLDLINHDFAQLTFSPGLEQEQDWKRVSPKRLQRLARRELSRPVLSSKSQEALRLQREESKRAGHIRSKAEKSAEQERKYALKQAKRRAKHHGH